MSSAMEVSLFCGLSITRLPKTMQVFVCVAGVLACFLIFFIIEEELFKQAHFNYPGVMTCGQAIFSSVFAFIENKIVTKHERKAPLSLYASIGFFGTFGTFTGLEALVYLNFPTWAMFKSSRMISVMIGSLLILGKKHTLKEYFGAFLIVFGLVLFTLGDVDVQPDFNPYGILMVLISLTLNSLEGNFQEKAFKGYSVSQSELMLYSNLMGFTFMTPLLLMTGELQEGLRVLFSDSRVFAMLMVNFCLCTAGIVFVIALLKVTNAVTTSMVTSLRKALTVILSFLLFSKPWSTKYLIGGISIGIGTYLEFQNTLSSKH